MNIINPRNPLTVLRIAEFTQQVKYVWDLFVNTTGSTETIYTIVTGKQEIMKN